MTIPKLRRLHDNFQTRFQGPDMQQTQIQVGVHCCPDIVSRFTNVLTKQVKQPVSSTSTFH